jgi:hypothetical protein
VCAAGRYGSPGSAPCLPLLIASASSLACLRETHILHVLLVPLLLVHAPVREPQPSSLYTFLWAGTFLLMRPRCSALLAPTARCRPSRTFGDERKAGLSQTNLAHMMLGCRHCSSDSNQRYMQLVILKKCDLVEATSLILIATGRRITTCCAGAA